MEELIQKMKEVLANTFVFGFKTHQYHVNVEGPDFYEYHKLLEVIYEEAEGAVDSIAEQIRQLDAYAPLHPTRLVQLSSILEGDVAPAPMVMLRTLFNDNATVMASLHEAYSLAERYSEIGLSNFLQDRMMAHKQHQYFLRSTLKGQEQ